MRPEPLAASGSLAEAPVALPVSAERSPSRLFCHDTAPLMLVVWWSCCAIFASRSGAEIGGRGLAWSAPATATIPAIRPATASTATRTKMMSLERMGFSFRRLLLLMVYPPMAPEATLQGCAVTKLHAARAARRGEIDRRAAWH